MPGAASFKRVLDGALFTDTRARRAPSEARPPRLGKLLLGSHGYRRKCAARLTRSGLGVVGRGELQLARASRRSAPHATPYQRD